MFIKYQSKPQKLAKDFLNYAKGVKIAKSGHTDQSCLSY